MNLPQLPETAIPASPANAKPVSRLDPVKPGATVPTKNGFETHRTRMVESQAELDRHRTSVLEGMKRLHKQLDAIPEIEVEKRLGVRGKIKVFEAQLEQVAEEQASLDRQKETLRREEERALIEQYRQSLKTAQIEGTVVAGKVRDLILRVLLPLRRQLDQWGEQERLARSNLLVPAKIEEGTGRRIPGHANTDAPHFSYATAIDGHFHEAIAQVILEAQRSEADLLQREKARGTAA
jgi:hypothetical protein